MLGGPVEVRSGQQFRSEVQGGSLRGRTCRLIEVKSALNEGVIGQALVGRWLFEQQVAGPFGLLVEQAAVMYRHEDPAVKWVVERLGLATIRSGVPAKNLGAALCYTGELDDLHIPPLQPVKIWRELSGADPRRRGRLRRAGVGRLSQGPRRRAVAAGTSWLDRAV